VLTRLALVGRATAVDMDAEGLWTVPDIDALFRQLPLLVNLRLSRTFRGGNEPRLGAAPVEWNWRSDGVAVFHWTTDAERKTWSMRQETVHLESRGGGVDAAMMAAVAVAMTQMSRAAVFELETAAHARWDVVEMTAGGRHSIGTLRDAQAWRTSVERKWPPLQCAEWTIGASRSSGMHDQPTTASDLVFLLGSTTRSCTWTGDGSHLMHWRADLGLLALFDHALTMQVLWLQTLEHKVREVNFSMPGITREASTPSSLRAWTTRFLELAPRGLHDTLASLSFAIHPNRDGDAGLMRRQDVTALLDHFPQLATIRLNMAGAHGDVAVESDALAAFSDHKQLTTLALLSSPLD